MARRTSPPATRVQAAKTPAVLAGSASIHRPTKPSNPKTARHGIAKPWQVELYRQVNICGEARYAVTLFSAMAGRAEIGVSEPQALARKAVWVTAGAEVEALNEIAPTVRERSKLIRDFMLHWVIAGECYLIGRDKVDTDPGYVTDPHTPIWEIVAVTELRNVGDVWSIRLDNGNYEDLPESTPVIRMWNPDPSNRREAWSPLRSLLPTLREIEWLTAHIFRQVRTRLMAAGVWFLPDNLTFPPPPPSAVEGGAEAIALMNEAEQFMMSLAASGMQELGEDEPSFPSVVMADPAALAAIDQDKLIQFWSEIDDKAMTLRSDAVRRFALGMDLPPEQVLGSSGLAVTGTSGSAGSVNHWGVWANEEQTISAHIEPALDAFVSVLTEGFLRIAVEKTDKVIAYDTTTLRLRQDRSKEAIELFDRGLLKGSVTVREVGFDPDNDMMDDREHRVWLLNRLSGGSVSPEQVQAALALLGIDLPVVVSGNDEAAPGQPGRNEPRSLEGHPHEGPPRVDHEHNEAPFNTLTASCEALVLRALEKAGNRLLNDGKRGRDRDRTTPAHLAHIAASAETPLMPGDFDFSLAPTVLDGLPAAKIELLTRMMGLFCYSLHQNREPYSRSALIKAVEGL